MNILPMRNEQYECLSDHFGIWVNFTFSSSATVRE